MALEEIKRSSWIAILTPLVFFFFFLAALSVVLRRNSNLLYDSVVEELDNLSSERKDLTKRISVCSIDELGTIAGLVNDFCRNLGKGIRGMKDCQHELSDAGAVMEKDASGMAASISQIFAAAEQVLEKTKNQKKSADISSLTISRIANHIKILDESIITQASSMNQASAAVEQMAGNISSIGAVTDRMTATFKTVEEAAAEGSRIQKESAERINVIVEQSQSLQATNRMIASIAAKTNLLAMNAAIEAAHAGESGKGFSVVADEIRKLAENSATESHKISAELKQVIETINRIVHDSQVSEGSFAEVSRRVGETEKLVVEVNNAIHEQKIGAGQVLEALRVMNDTAAKVTAGSRDMRQGNEEMLRQIKVLEVSAGEISVSMNEVFGGIKSLDTGARGVSEVAVTNRSTIRKISDIVDEFDV